MVIKTVCDRLTGEYSAAKYPSGHDDIDSPAVYWAYEEVVKNRLEEFDPGKPTDGIPGYLAYSHGGKRMKTRTGRFLTKKLQLDDKLNESTIRQISDKINKALFAEMEVRLDKGKAITENYRKHVGSSSCMTGCESCYTKLYEYNPDRFQQLVMFFVSDSARAIVHKLDNGKYLLDRVYSSSEHLKEEMKKYAAEKGWLWYDDGATQIQFGNEGFIDDYSEIVVSGLVYEDGEVPYMDTFFKYKVVDGKLNIYHDKATGRYDGTLDSTEGITEDGVLCSYCEEIYNDRYIIVVNGDCICEDCLHDNFVHCDHCNTWRQNAEPTVIISHSFSKMDMEVCECCIDFYLECTKCEEWFREDDIETVGDNVVCSKCLSENYHKCEDCDEWFSKLTELKCNEWVCDNCLKDYYKCRECDDYVTINEIIVATHGNTCLDCAGLGECKGQDKFDFDDFPVIEKTKINMSFKDYCSVKQTWASINYGAMEPTWGISEVSA